MSDDIQNKTITISSVQDTGDAIKLRDQNNLTYKVWKETKDGNNTKPYQQYLDMELGPMKSARIGYVIDVFDYKGKSIKSKKIINFMETNEMAKKSQSIPQPIRGALVGEEVWEAKDRLHAAQTAANVIATLNEGSGKTFDDMRQEFDRAFSWLLEKKNGEGDKQTNTDDVPF